VGEAELGEHGARRSEAEVLDEILPQDAHGHGVEEKRTLSGEADHAPLRVQLQQFLVMQILDAHPIASIIMKGLDFILTDPARRKSICATQSTEIK
jgi:hypothetical protein